MSRISQVMSWKLLQLDSNLKTCICIKSKMTDKKDKSHLTYWTVLNFGLLTHMSANNLIGYTLDSDLMGKTHKITNVASLKISDKTWILGKCKKWPRAVFRSIKWKKMAIHYAKIYFGWGKNKWGQMRLVFWPPCHTLGPFFCTCPIAKYLGYGK